MGRLLSGAPGEGPGDTKLNKNHHCQLANQPEAGLVGGHLKQHVAILRCLEMRLVASRNLGLILKQL